VIAKDIVFDSNDEQQHQLKRDIPLIEALRIVQTSRLTDCVLRIICELTCNPTQYGDQGRKVFRNLVKIQLNKTLPQQDTDVFKEASKKGMQLKQKKECEKCYELYNDCKSDSKDLIAVSAMFEI